MDERVAASWDPVALHDDIIRVSEHVISPALLQHVRALDQNGWRKLASHIENSRNGVVTSLLLYQRRLSAEQMAHLLDLHEALATSLVGYMIFPDLMGVPHDQLPRTTTPPEVLQQSWCESTANGLQRVLVLVKELSETLVQPR